MGLKRVMPSEYKTKGWYNQKAENKLKDLPIPYTVDEIEGLKNHIVLTYQMKDIIFWVENYLLGKTSFSFQDWEQMNKEFGLEKERGYFAGIHDKKGNKLSSSQIDTSGWREYQTFEDFWNETRKGKYQQFSMSQGLSKRTTVINDFVGGKADIQRTLLNLPKNMKRSINIMGQSEYNIFINGACFEKTDVFKKNYYATLKKMTKEKENILGVNFYTGCRTGHYTIITKITTTPWEEHKLFNLGGSIDFIRRLHFLLMELDFLTNVPYHAYGTIIVGSDSEITNLLSKIDDKQPWYFFNGIESKKVQNHQCEKITFEEDELEEYEKINKELEI